MQEFVKLYGKRIGRLLLENTALFKTQSKVEIGLFVLFALFFVMSFAFILYGTRICIFLKLYSPDLAYIYTGLVLMGACLIFAGLGLAFQLYRYKRLKDLSNEVTDLMEITAARAEYELNKTVNEKPTETVLAVAILGYTLGRRYFQ